MLWILNAYIVLKSKPYIYSNPEKPPSVDAIMVLGASVYRSKKLSPPLEQRMLTAIHFHLAHQTTPLLLTGFAVKGGYNEPDAMSQYAVKKMISKKDIRLDYKGTSTYASMANYKRENPHGSVLIITQAYHLPRSLYIARKLGLEAYGLIAPEANPKLGKPVASIREISSRIKDFCLLQLFSLFH